MESYGNTSSASVPIALNELNEKGLIERGDKIVLAGFGGGMTWGCYDRRMVACITANAVYIYY